jgi:hypothetical protein
VALRNLDSHALIVYHPPREGKELAHPRELLLIEPRSGTRTEGVAASILAA